MLLDRKRIRKWAKWVALVLAIVFVLSFLFMGVGYGGAGFNISEIFSGGCTETTAVPAAQSQLQVHLATLQTDPDNIVALEGVISIYLAQDEFANAATYMKRLVEADPSRTDVYMDLAALYMRTEVGDYASAVEVLGKAQEAFPDDPEVYLRLGVAQRAVGNTEAAIRAWQEYLRLDPDGDQAGAVTEALKEMTAATTTVTPAAPTTTLPGSTTTTQ